MIITSKDNETIKAIKKLKQKKYRNEKYIVEGIKMIQEAIIEKAEIELIVIKTGFNSELDISKYNTIEVTEKVFNELTDVVSPQGIIAVIKKNNNISIDLNCPFILALDGIQDPGNLGTIIRTADAGNIKQLIISKDTVDPYSSKVIRATMGSIFRIKIIEAERISETLTNLQNKGFEIITTELDANKSFYDIDYNKKVVVIGNEANGVSNEVRKLASIKVKIPMLGKTESLNAAVAASLVIYEHVRQLIKL